MIRTATASLALSLFLGLTGCISSGVEPLVEASEPEEEAAIAEASADLEPDAWRTLLTRDVMDVESKGQQFLESSFKLYDQLLTEAEKPVLETELATGRERFAELVRATRRLAEDLERPEVKEQLGLAGEEDLADLKRLTALFATAPIDVTVPATESKSATYTERLLGDAAPSVAADPLPEEGLAQAERDALELLDRLRTVSRDLAFVSDTVSAWVQAPEDEVPTELMIGPYAMDEDAKAPLGR